MAHLKYAVLSVCQWYSPHLSISEIKFVPGEVDETIAQFTSAYYSCFSSKYASKLTVQSMLEHVRLGSDSVVMSQFHLYTLYNVRTHVSVQPNLTPDPPTKKSRKGLVKSLYSAHVAVHHIVHTNQIRASGHMTLKYVNYGPNPCVFAKNS